VEEDDVAEERAGSGVGTKEQVEPAQDHPRRGRVRRPGGASPGEPPEPASAFPRSSRPASAVWREQALADITKAQLLANRLRFDSAQDGAHVSVAVLDGVDESLAAARRAALGAGLNPLEQLVSAWRGSGVERAWGQLDAADEALLRVAPDSFVLGQLPRLRARARRALGPDDPRRMALEAIAKRVPGAPLDEIDREVLGAVLHATNCEARRKQARVRSFRNLLIVTSVVLWLLVVGLALLGSSRPTLIPLCFNPTGQVVCPTQESPVDVPPGGGSPGQPPANTAPAADYDTAIADTVTPWDIFVIEVVGLIAAAVATAAALRNIRGTSTPYSVPMALAALKLPTGALTAVLGLILMRGEFVPGLSALDFPAQIIAWAIIFGYAQQILTRFVDQRAQSVLEGAVPVAPHPSADAARAPAPAAAADEREER
jgi:hypothetical protein